MNAFEEMDELFRRADFSAENPELKRRLWQKILERISENDDEDYELTKDDLINLAAAGEHHSRWNFG